MTLVEIMVVLGIIGLLVGMTVPAMTHYARQVRLKTATRQIIGLISLARSRAIASHDDQSVVIDPERHEVRVVDLASGEALDQVVRVSSSTTLALRVGKEASSLTQFIFHPTGSLAGRTVSLLVGDGEKQHTITVTGITGSISVE